MQNAIFAEILKKVLKKQLKKLLKKEKALLLQCQPQRAQRKTTLESTPAKQEDPTPHKVLSAGQ
jgi:hypothetical protein